MDTTTGNTIIMKTDNLQLHNTFPTPIYINIFDNVEEIKNEILNIEDQVEFQSAKNLPTISPELSKRSITKTLDILNEFGLKTFENELHTNISAFQQILNAPKYNYFLSTWFSKIDIGQLSYPQLTLNSDITGYYFYNVQDCDTKINFISPVQAAAASVIFNHAHKNFMITPEEGMLVLFPSWLWNLFTMNHQQGTCKSIAISVYYDRWN